MPFLNADPKDAAYGLLVRFDEFKVMYRKRLLDQFAPGMSPGSLHLQLERFTVDHSPLPCSCHLPFHTSIATIRSRQGQLSEAYGAGDAANSNLGGLKFRLRSCKGRTYGKPEVVRALVFTRILLK